MNSYTAPQSAMMTLNQTEQAALYASSEAIGGYLESIGKTDMSDMTEMEWLGFIAHAYNIMSNEIRIIVDSDVPF
jgi:archaellum component FlaD/FlaE